MHGCSGHINITDSSQTSAYTSLEVPQNKRKWGERVPHEHHQMPTTISSLKMCNFASSWKFIVRIWCGKNMTRFIFCIDTFMWPSVTDNEHTTTPNNSKGLLISYLTTKSLHIINNYNYLCKNYGFATIKVIIKSSEIEKEAKLRLKTLNNWEEVRRWNKKRPKKQTNKTHLDLIYTERS